ncbi:perlucin-like protein [Saccostrea cucullata]|uniref:perlucin-like protein n=1 Tax=Saccostrea cuccullata TaxID=36930 RepID=UPI002ECFD2F0
MPPKSFVLFLLLVTCMEHIQACRDGWVQHQDKCYMFSMLAEPWPAASSICQAYHTYLAEPKTMSEMNFISGFAEHLRKDYWLGISDIINENHWVYSSNMDDISINNWGKNEPNGHTGENCVLALAGLHYKWEDYPCDTVKPFVCEMLLGSEPGESVIG